MMIRAVKIILIVLSVFAITSARANEESIPDFSFETKNVLQGIANQKKRIAAFYKSADSRFFVLVDNVSELIQEQNISPAEKNLYLKRLLVFLQNIHRPYSGRYFTEGTYFNSLSYYPTMIEWNLNNTLPKNLQTYAAFSVKSARLIPNDSIAEKFLSEILSENPDDFFRCAEEFDDRAFAVRLLEKAVALAPESAKRYYVSDNAVKNILSRSNDSLVKRSFEIFNAFGMRSNAYLLLNKIANSELTIEQADSIGKNSYAMFHLLMQEQQPNYSAYRHINNYCIEVIRKINEEPARENIFSRYAAEELLALLCFAHKEATFATFRELLEVTLKKLNGSVFSKAVIEKFGTEKLRELTLHCEKNKMLNNLLSMVSDNDKNYLLAISADLPNNAEKKNESRIPPLKTFEDKNTFALIAGNNVTASTENAITFSSRKTDVARPRVEPVKISLDEKTREVLSMKKNILQTIQNIPAFIEKEYAEQILNYAAQKEPDELFKKTDAFKNSKFSKSVLEQCAVNAPVSLKRYLNNATLPVNYILQRSDNATVKKIFEIAPQLGSRSKTLLLLDDIVKGKLSVSEASAISAQPEKLFSALVKIVSQQDYIGKYSIEREMSNYSLRFIREINNKIAAGEPMAFLAAENFKCEDLYFLMLYGREEVFTSTFNGLFDRFLQKLNACDREIFFQSVNNNQCRNFISLCANFDKLDELLEKFSPEAKRQLLISYTSHLENEQDALSTIALIAEAISNIKNERVLVSLQTNIKDEYERVKKANDPIGISIYGILSSMISGNAKVETAWYRTVSEQFKISPVGLLPASSLFSEKKLCVQQMYFYDDEDGQSSFANFIHTYKNQPSWTIQDKHTYVIVSSTKGVPVQIFANKPEYEQQGTDAIHLAFKNARITPSVVIHRGHSFYTESTLEKIPASAKLVFVGSCGGFYKVSIALENAPDAHVISTKQIGTKAINDAMLFALSENIREGKDIAWNDFWDKMRAKLGSNQYFSDYIPPNKNLESIFIREYYKLLGV